jgi:phosphoglycerate kinase
MLLTEVHNSTVLVRVNYDLPSLSDTARIYDGMETIKLLTAQGNTVILLTHWGRPQGYEPELSMERQLDIINSILHENNLASITFLDQYKSFESAKAYIKSQSQGSILLLENTRFDPREYSSDTNEILELSNEYANLGDFFVDEAFAVSHRSEVTNSGIKSVLPHCVGLSYQHEVEVLSLLRDSPVHPFVVIMAGAKLETKLPLIQKMILKADKLILGGLLSFTFLQAQKELYPHLESAQIDFPTEVVEQHFLHIAKDLLLDYPDKIVLPLDFEYEGKQALDVGNTTINKYIETISISKTVFWNGTLGKYEQPPFDHATRTLAKHIGDLADCYTVIGGGDTLSALDLETISNFDFVSMGGGATLEFLAKTK